MNTKKLLAAYSVAGVLLWIAGLITWDSTSDADAVPYQAMFTAIACSAWGSAFLSTLPLWRRIAVLEAHVAATKDDDVTA